MFIFKERFPYNPICRNLSNETQTQLTVDDPEIRMIIIVVVVAEYFRQNLNDERSFCFSYECEVLVLYDFREGHVQFSIIINRRQKNFRIIR